MHFSRRGLHLFRQFVFRHRLYFFSFFRCLLADLSEGCAVGMEVDGDVGDAGALDEEGDEEGDFMLLVVVGMMLWAL